MGDEPNDFEVHPTPEAGAHMQANHGRAYGLIDAVAPVHERYRDARATQEARGWPATRISQLGSGVWATDPDYAEKIRTILVEMERMLGGSGKTPPNGSEPFPAGRTCLGVLTPTDGDPPPWLGARFGDPSKYQRLDIAGGFHCGWDVWEEEGAAVLSPLDGVVIESRDRDTVTQAYNMAVQVQFENGLVMQVLHCKQGSMLPLGTRVKRGQRICRIGYFGPAIGHPHAHIEFFRSREAALAYDHKRAVDPYVVRRDHLREDSRLVRVPQHYRWWVDRNTRPTDGKRVLPVDAPVAEKAAAFVEEPKIPSDVTVGCGTGEPLLKGATPGDLVESGHP